MSLVLVADVGGTNTRIAVADKLTGACEQIRQYRNSDFESLEDIVRAYRGEQGAVAIEAAAFAVAGPVSGGRMKLTNLPWEIDTQSLSGAVDGVGVRLLNDFEALAMALPYLTGAQRVALNDFEPDEEAPRIVLGPGTGLGVSTLVRVGAARWKAIAGEGGHVSLPIIDERDFRLYQIMLRDVKRVSAERVLSGAGILRLYRAMAALDDMAATLGSPEEITGAALSGGDRLAEGTMKQFVTWLARVAANIALVTMPRGGVYLGGGICPQIRPWLEDSIFVERFSDVGRMSGLLANLPIFLIDAEAPALIGAAIFAGSQSAQTSLDT